MGQITLYTAYGLTGCCNKTGAHKLANSMKNENNDLVIRALRRDLNYATVYVRLMKASQTRTLQPG